jgi:hypothetical protein
MTTTTADLKVIKKLHPMQAGTVKLVRTYGEALVCVRYRKDAPGTTRYTTVELIVDKTPISPRLPDWVEVRINFADTDLRAKAKAQGAKWIAEKRLWSMPRTVAKALALLPATFKK